MTTDIIMTTNETKKTELVVITPKVQEYVCAWHVATKKTITAIFDQSTLLAKAKNELSATDYKSFLKEAQVTNSTAKKFLTIASKIDILSKCGSSLPHNWTTVYNIAKYDNSEIQNLIDKDLISFDMTAKQITANLQSISVTSSPSNEVPTSVTTSTPSNEKIDVLSSELSSSKLPSLEGASVLVDLAKIPIEERQFVLRDLAKLRERYEAALFSDKAKAMLLVCEQVGDTQVMRKAA